MDSRERLADELVETGRSKRSSLNEYQQRADDDKIRAMYLTVIDAILASDWLRDTLAAERERCAKVAGNWLSANAHNCDMEMMRIRYGEEATGHARNLLEVMAEEVPARIRNLEPEASDDRG